MKQKDRRWLKYALIGLMVLLCVLAFVFFGTNSELLKGQGSVSATPIPAATAEPKGIPLSAFLNAVREGGAELGEVDRMDDGRLVYPLEFPNGNDSGSVTLTTDKLGRVLSYELRLGYMYAGDIERMQGKAAYEAVLKEYERRIELDEGVIRGQLDAILDLCGQSAGVGSTDRQKLTSAVIAAYENGKDHSKKYGALRVCCNTARGEQDSEFLLELIFDLTKMK